MLKLMKAGGLKQLVLKRLQDSPKASFKKLEVRFMLQELREHCSLVRFQLSG